MDEDGRDATPVTTSRAGASRLGVHFGSGGVQLSAPADADPEVCLKRRATAGTPVSRRSQSKYETKRITESATQRAEPCSIEIFQHPARAGIIAGRATNANQFSELTG